MSQFAMAQESADLGYENDAPMANGEETHTVANEIAEVQGLQFEAADADDAAEQLDQEAEKTEEVAEAVEEEVAQERALDPTAAKLLKLAFKNIVGAKYAGQQLPAQEAFNGSKSEAREQTRIALEGIKDTLKKFWEAIKAQFKKVYDKIKAWIVKTFSAAKKLKDRAQKIQEKASSTVGTIEEKSFSFAQTKAIAIDGKYNEASSLLTGLNEVRKGIESTLSTMKKDKVDDAVEEMINGVKASFTGSGKTRDVSLSAFASAFAEIFDSIKAGSSVPASVGDSKKYIEQFGDSNEITVNGAFGLPGGKAIVTVRPKTVSGSGNLEMVTKHLKAFRISLSNDKYTPREVSDGDVKTLTTSQIDKVCDDVIEIGETIYTYEKAWSNRDRFIDKVIKDTDEIVKDFDTEDDADSRDQRHFRGYINAQVACVRRKNNFEANLCSYALTTANAFLNYAERSLAQHKAK